MAGAASHNSMVLCALTTCLKTLNAGVFFASLLRASSLTRLTTFAIDCLCSLPPCMAGAMSHHRSSIAHYTARWQA